MTRRGEGRIRKERVRLFISGERMKDERKS